MTFYRNRGRRFLDVELSAVGLLLLLPVLLLLGLLIRVARRHEVRPGITGWAQVNGRNLLTWEETFALDVRYVDHLHFAWDLRILVRTVAGVLRQHDVSADGHATMPRFQGVRR